MSGFKVFFTQNNIKRSFFTGITYDHLWSVFFFFFRVVAGRKWFVEAQRTTEIEDYLIYLVYAKIICCSRSTRSCVELKAVTFYLDVQGSRDSSSCFLSKQETTNLYLSDQRGVDRVCSTAYHVVPKKLFGSC